MVEVQKGKILALLDDGNVVEVETKGVFRVGQEIPIEERVVTEKVLKVLRWGRASVVASGLAAVITLIAFASPGLWPTHNLKENDKPQTNIQAEIPKPKKSKQEVAKNTPENKPVSKPLKKSNPKGSKGSKVNSKRNEGNIQNNFMPGPGSPGIRVIDVVKQTPAKQQEKPSERTPDRTPERTPERKNENIPVKQPVKQIAKEPTKKNSSKKNDTRLVKLTVQINLPNPIHVLSPVVRITKKIL